MKKYRIHLTYIFHITFPNRYFCIYIELFELPFNIFLCYSKILRLTITHSGLTTVIIFECSYEKVSTFCKVFQLFEYSNQKVIDLPKIWKGGIQLQYCLSSQTIETVNRNWNHGGYWQLSTFWIYQKYYRFAIWFEYHFKYLYIYTKSQLNELSI